MLRLRTSGSIFRRTSTSIVGLSFRLERNVYKIEIVFQVFKIDGERFCVGINSRDDLGDALRLPLRRFASDESIQSPRHNPENVTEIVFAQQSNVRAARRWEAQVKFPLRTVFARPKRLGIQHTCESMAPSPLHLPIRCRNLLLFHFR